MIYTGIGARNTPDDVLQIMYDLGYELALKGHTLRSGGALGADTAFEHGCEDAAGTMEIYLPWRGYNQKQKGIVLTVEDNQDEYEKAEIIAAYHHPNWKACSYGVRKLHTRNVFQLLGSDLETPSDFLICWTPAGKEVGGTGQTLRMAKSLGIEIVNLGDPTLNHQSIIKKVISL